MGRYSLNNMEHFGTQYSLKPKEDQLSPNVLQIFGAKGEKKQTKPKGTYYSTIEKIVKLQN